MIEPIIFLLILGALLLGIGFAIKVLNRVLIAKKDTDKIYQELKNLSETQNEILYARDMNESPEQSSRRIPSSRTRIRVSRLAIRIPRTNDERFNLLAMFNIVKSAIDERCYVHDFRIENEDITVGFAFERIIDGSELDEFRKLNYFNHCAMTLSVHEQEVRSIDAYYPDRRESVSVDDFIDTTQTENEEEEEEEPNNNRRRLIIT